MSDELRPHIERTPFTPQHPPSRVTFYFCPACGRSIRGNYNLDPARKACSKTWHLTTAIAAKYVLVQDQTDAPQGKDGGA